jgi:hypothetical protein
MQHLDAAFSYFTPKTTSIGRGRDNNSKKRHVQDYLVRWTSRHRGRFPRQQVFKALFLKVNYLKKMNSLVLIITTLNLVMAIVDPNACLTIKGSTTMADFEGYSILKNLVNNSNTIAELDAYVASQSDQNPAYLSWFRCLFFVYFYNICN